MRLWWRYHKVQPGDTLASLSRSYYMPVKSIATANHLDGTELEAGAKVILPVAAGKHPFSDNATYARRITRYKVRRGDTVETVAENFGVSAQMVRRWNGLHGGDSLRGRKVLALHLPVSPSSEPTTASKSTARARKPAQTATAKVPGAKSVKAVDQDTSGQAAVLRHTV